MKQKMAVSELNRAATVRERTVQTNYQSTVRLLTRAALIARPNHREHVPCTAWANDVGIGIGLCTQVRTMPIRIPIATY